MTVMLALVAAPGDRQAWEGKGQLWACTHESQIISGGWTGPCFNLGLLLFDYGEANRPGYGRD